MSQKQNQHYINYHITDAASYNNIFKSKNNNTIKKNNNIEKNNTIEKNNIENMKNLKI